MFLIATVCCAVLVLAAGALWWSMRRTPAEEDIAITPAAMQYHQPVRKTAHPRLDLAAGLVTVAQNVLTPARRRNANTAEPKTVPTVAPRPKNGAAMPAKRERLDLAYFNENMGDLSDPDLNRDFRRPFGSVAVPESR